MARVYEELEIKQPKVIQSTLTEVTCDRCGKPCLARGFGHRGPWAVLEHHIIGQGADTKTIDLCHDCTAVVLEVISGGS